MTSEVLRGIIFGIAVIALIAQFVYDMVQSRERKQDNDTLRATVDRLNMTVDRIEGNLKQLVAQGKITREEARRVLTATVQERPKVEETLDAEVIRKKKE